MKKKLTLFVFAFIMLFSSILCGCDLITDNLSVKLNKPVAVLTYKDNTKVTITVKEFNIAMNNYGVELMQNNSYSYEQAAEETLNALINRKVMLIEAKSKFQLTNKDKNDLWLNTYDALIANIESFEEKVRTDWNMSVQKPEEPEKDEIVKYTEYEKKAYVTYDEVLNKLVIKVVNDEHQSEEAVAKDKNTLKQVIFDEVANSGSKIRKEALSRYIKQLKLNEDGQRLSTDKDSMFIREIERIYNNLEETLYITKLQNFYQYGNSEGSDGDYTSIISVNDVLNKYKYMMLSSKTLYEANNSKFDSDMVDSFSSVNYVINDKYFFVSHILMKFTDEQQAIYDNLSNQLDCGEISLLEYQTSLDSLYNQVTAIVRDEDGKVIENQSISAEDLLKSINQDLNQYKSYEEKVEVFKNYLYRHNEDSGINNADYMYIVGEDNSKMVETFTQSSRELNENGDLGAISGLVRSNYGIHIIFYGGKVENVFEIPTIGDFSLSENDIWKLCDKKLNAMNNKTLFDLVYEKLQSDNYSTFESMQIRLLKEDINIVKYPKNYKQN